MSRTNYSSSNPLLLEEQYGDLAHLERLFRWFLAMLFLGVTAGIFISLSHKDAKQAFMVGVGYIPIAGAYLLVRRKKFETAITMLAVILIALMTIVATQGQGIHHISVIGYPAILIVASMVSRKRTMVLLTLYTIVCLGWLVFGELQGFYTPVKWERSVAGDFFSASVIIIVTALMVRMISESLFQSNLRYRKELRERQLAEEALAFSEEKFTQAFHSSPVMMTIEGADHKFVDVNRSFVEGIGYTRSEALGLTASDLKLWSSEEDVEKVRGALARGEEIKNLELRFRRKSGEIGVALMSSDRFEAHSVHYELTSALDISDRKRAEAERSQRAEEVALLYRLGMALASGENLYQAMRAFVQELKNVMTVDAFHIGLYDAETDIFSYSLFLNLDEDLQPPPRKLREKPGLTWEVLSTRTSLYLEDVADPQVKNAHNIVWIQDAPIRSYLGIPLILQNRVIGIMSVQSMRPAAYSSDQIRLLETIAAQVAITIEKLSLLDQVKHELAERKRAEGELQQREIILDAVAVSAELLFKAPDWRSEVDGMLERLGKSIRATHAYLFENSQKTGGEMTTSMMFEWTMPGFMSDLDDPRYLGMQITEDDLASWYRTMSQGDPYIGDRKRLDGNDYNYILARGMKALLDVPIFIDGFWWGCIGFDDLAQEREWSYAEVDGLVVAANVLAGAIKRSQIDAALQAELSQRKQMQDILFDEKERAEVTLHSIGDAVITTDIHAQVEYLNPVAENLTGWNIKDAFGQPLERVFKVINEESRKPVLDPVARCLQEGRVIELANHSILIRRDGQEFSIDDSAAPIRNRKGEVIGAVLVFHDITEERRLTRQVAHDAMHDGLTGLVNRREFEKRLGRALNSAKERNLTHVLCYLDLDQFKIVNDTAGHVAGDELLRQLAELLSGLFRQRDTFARLGGDEFGLLLENCQLDQAQVICNKILAKTRDFSFAWGGNNFQVSVSIGITPITAEKESANQLLSQADIACYAAKDLGRNRFNVYQSEDSETAQRHGEIIQAARMRDAVINDQFILYCQPIAELRQESQDFSRYEVLLRMQNDENKLSLPSAFIPSAERYGLMPAIDRWVIRRTFAAIAKSKLQGVQVTINLSGNSLDDDGLFEYVVEQLNEFSIPPTQICFEITETAAIHHISKARDFTQAFRERGGKIALDDFGSGFSSFRYLKTLPVDYIKIDGEFVREMLANPNDQAMVEAITQVAHTLGIYVIAEHATNIETVNRLRELGVEGAQGFGIGFPIPVEDAWKNETQDQKRNQP